MSNRTTIKLRNPIKFGSQTIEQLEFRPLKGKDLRRLKTPKERPLAMTLELAGYLSGQVKEVIDELEGDDVQEVLELVSAFFGDSQETGTEP